MSNESVLIVEDTPVNLKLVRVLLSRYGFDVRTATTAEEALEVLQQFHPRLVLTDIQLPGMDGLELTRRLKSDPAMRDTMVVALTAFAMKTDQEKAVGAGCDGYITKPIDTRTFPLQILKYLGRDPEACNPVSPASPAEPSVNNSLMREIQTTFLSEGVEQSGRLLSTLEAGFDQAQALVTLHRWVGAAGSVGYPEISQNARELETVLQQNGSSSQVRARELVTRLARLFTDALESDRGQPSGTQVAVQEAEHKPAPVAIPAPEDIAPPELVAALAGKRFALAGFAQPEAARLSKALDGFQAFSRDLGSDALPDLE